MISPDYRSEEFIRASEGKPLAEIKSLIYGELNDTKDSKGTTIYKIGGMSDGDYRRKKKVFSDRRANYESFLGALNFLTGTRSWPATAPAGFGAKVLPLMRAALVADPTDQELRKFIEKEDAAIW